MPSPSLPLSCSNILLICVQTKSSTYTISQLVYALIYILNIVNDNILAILVNNYQADNLSMWSQVCLFVFFFFFLKVEKGLHCIN